MPRPRKKQRNKEMLEKYIYEKKTYRDLAKEYGIHFTSVGEIILREKAELKERLNK